MPGKVYTDYLSNLVEIVVNIIEDRDSRSNTTKNCKSLKTHSIRMGITSGDFRVILGPARTRYADERQHFVSSA